MESLLRSGLRVLRKIAGKNTYIERFLKRLYDTVKSTIEKKYVGPNFVVFWSGSQRKKRIGIYVKGSCDLVSIFSCQPFILDVLNGTCCILREGAVWDSRSDFLLQTLQYFPQEHLEPVTKKLKLPDDYFKQSQLFKKSMTITWLHDLEEFPKDVIIMSIGPDVIRTLYRHREHGFLVDPGGWWFNQSMNNVLSDLSVASWFRENFLNVGRISVDGFIENFTKIIQLLKNNTDAHILMFNTLTVEPGNPTYNYQFVRNSLVMRAREFNLALVELSSKLDFSIVDLDRVLKKAGINNQVDYAHFPAELYPLIAKEAFRIMRDLEIF